MKHKIRRVYVPKWEEKIFSEAFKEPVQPKGIDEEEIEARLSWFYARKVPMDIMIEGRISDSDGSYQLITDIGMQTIWSMYCSKGKGFDSQYVNGLLLQCGFKFITAQKEFAQLQTWRKELPKDISDEELVSVTAPQRMRPASSVYESNLQIVNETISTPINRRVHDALSELLNSGSSRAASIPDSQISDWSGSTQLV